jgi:glyoxylase-like metal-dependent hydrolase (beta-lactamase superfamily II)
MANARQYGTARVHRIVDLDLFPIPIDFIFPGATIGALDANRDLLAGAHVDFQAGKVLLAIQSHLIRFGGKTILMDTCVGEHKERPLRPDWHQRAHTRYLDNLAAAGCTPDDIDIVMCTHLHADHVGWNTKLESGRWVPTFPNARYLMSQIEIDHRAHELTQNPQANHGSYQDSVLPILERDLHKTVTAGDEIVGGTTIRPLPGHAPGQIGLEVAAGAGTQLLFVGDAIHNPAQVFQPGWSSAFCHDKAQAEQTRRGILERAAQEDLILIPAHLRAAHMQIRLQNGGYLPVFAD